MVQVTNMEYGWGIKVVLLDLKLISDLVSNREVLIEAIAKSKLLVMNQLRE